MKKNNKVFYWTLGIILGILIILFGASFLSVTGTSCNLGSWSVSSYDTVKNSLTLSWEVNPLTSSGCVGTYSVANRGVPTFQNQPALCKQFGFTYLDSPNGDGNNCVLESGNWNQFLQNKSFTDGGSCTHICSHRNGNCYWGDNVIGGNAGTFDGYVFNVGEPRINGDDIPSCKGSVVIAPPVVCQEGQNQCNGNDYQICQNNGWISQGQQVGKCNVQCVQDTDCGANSNVGMPFCSGNNLIQGTNVNTCVNNACIKSSSNTTLLCTNGCSNGVCSGATSPPTNNYLLWIVAGIMVLLVVVILVFLKFRRR